MHRESFVGSEGKKKNLAGKLSSVQSDETQTEALAVLAVLAALTAL